MTCNLQRIQNYAARVILRLLRSSNIAIHLESLHWLPVNVRSTYKIACLCYHCHSSTVSSYVADMPQNRPSHTATLAPAHTPCLFSIDLHPVRQRVVIARFPLLLLLTGTIPNKVRCAPSLSSFKSRLMTYLLRSVCKDLTFSLITVHMCMVWPCHSFVDGLS